jgi:hypothetical protein
MIAKLLPVVAAVSLYAQAPGAPRIPGQNPDGMRIYLWGGLKTHGPGQHDYPQFLADWSKLLTEKGAVVAGGFRGPTREELARTDVVVIYKGDSGYLTDAAKADLEAYVQRGGGLVSLHDALCGPDPAYYSKFLGGAKKHGEVNYTLDAPVPYTVADKDHPIMKDMSNITVFDEAFFNLTWAANPGIHVLANAEIAPTRSAGEHKGEKVPQMWTTISITTRSSAPCSAASPGRARSLSTNSLTMSRHRARRAHSDLPPTNKSAGYSAWRASDEGQSQTAYSLRYCADCLPT